MSFSNYLETKVLGHVFGGTAYTAPSKYVALFTSAPGEAGGGGEVSGGSYARKPVTFTVSGNTASNDVVVEFPTASADWGTVTHMAIFDAVSGGNMLAYAALTASRTILAGDIARFPIGDITITLD